jgi:hypothetical protein
MINVQRINANLDKMLETSKSKNFLNHLIRAYFPVTNVVKVLDKPRGKNFKCVLTRDALISVEEILEGMHTDTFRNDFLEFAKTMLDEKSDVSTPMANLVGEKKLGLTGKDTTTYMSFAAYQVFYNWVVQKMLSGDKHINWLFNSIRKSSDGTAKLPTRPKKIKDPEPTIDMTSTYQLGEMPIFQTLLGKFKDDENNPHI